MKASTDTCRSLIVGVSQHDPERWREFDSIYRPMLCAFLRKQRLSTVEAQDVVQSVYVKLLLKIDTYDSTRCKFRTWLFSLAHHALLDAARRQATYNKALHGWARAVLRGSASDSVKMAEEWDTLHRTKVLEHVLKRVRASISPRAWACFEQRLLRDRPAAEIAADLNIKANAVYVNACRVLKVVTTACREFDEDVSDDFESGASRRA